MDAGKFYMLTDGICYYFSFLSNSVYFNLLGILNEFGNYNRVLL